MLPLQDEEVHVKTTVLAPAAVRGVFEFPSLGRSRPRGGSGGRFGSTQIMDNSMHVEQQVPLQVLPVYVILYL